MKPTFTKANRLKHMMREMKKGSKVKKLFFYACFQAFTSASLLLMTKENWSEFLGV